MSIQRYRINQSERLAGGIFSPDEIVQYRGNDVWVVEQKHGRGGWCKWDDVKRLIKEVEELRKQKDAE